jgi:hypothetical protein
MGDLKCVVLTSLFADRDSARWGLPDYVVERRRTLFWDLFVSDIWQVST